MGQALHPDELNRFSLLSRELLTWNGRMSLTAVTEPDDVQVKHFLDSLTVASVVKDELPQETGRLVDVGSGGGFPGLPLAIVLPWLDVILMEATAKKVRFLNHTIGVLALPNARALYGRAEQLARDDTQREVYDIAVARAVGSAATLVELLAPLLRFGGLAILMKTHAAVDRELDAAAAALSKLHAEVEKIHSVQVPGLDDRALVLIRKKAATPPEFPRRPGVPERRPLTR